MSPNSIAVRDRRIQPMGDGGCESTTLTKGLADVSNPHEPNTLRPILITEGVGSLFPEGVRQGGP
jgi:hypothetical protein